MRSGTTFDWRWIVVIVVALIFFGQLSLTPSAGLVVIILAIGTYWAIMAGLEPWRGRGPVLGNRRVTYWRGQRIELGPPRRSRLRVPPVTALLVSLFYLFLGAGLLFATLRVLLRLLVP